MGVTKTRRRARRRNLRSNGVVAGAEPARERAAPAPVGAPAAAEPLPGAEGEGAEVMAVAALAQLGIEAAAKYTKLRRKLVKDCWSSLRLLCGL
jgi:hypothetical protein